MYGCMVWSSTNLIFDSVGADSKGLTILFGLHLHSHNLLDWKKLFYNNQENLFCNLLDEAKRPYELLTVPFLLCSAGCTDIYSLDCLDTHNEVHIELINKEGILPKSLLIVKILCTNVWHGGSG